MRMDAVVIDHGLAIDQQSRAVIGTEQKFVLARFFEFELRLKPDAEIVGPLGDSEIQATALARRRGLQLGELWNAVPVAVINREIYVRLDLDVFHQVLPQI